MPKKGSRFRRPTGSECFAFIGWQLKDARYAKAKSIPDSAWGQIEIIFRRKYPRYHYFCKRSLLTLKQFKQWANSSSPGSIWNEYYKGHI